jgi:hypothetical protein
MIFTSSVLSAVSYDIQLVSLKCPSKIISCSNFYFQVSRLIEMQSKEYIEVSTITVIFETAISFSVSAGIFLTFLLVSCEFSNFNLLLNLSSFFCFFIPSQLVSDHKHLGLALSIDRTTPQPACNLLYKYNF